MNEQLQELREIIKELNTTIYLMTYKEAAEILGVKAQTLRQWVCYGKISYIKIASAVRFKQEHIDAFIEKSTQKARR